MQEVLLLGHRALVWANWEQYTNTEPVCVHGPSIIPITEYTGIHTIDAFLRLREQHVASDTPFVLRQTRIWAMAPTACYEGLVAGQSSKAVTYSAAFDMLYTDLHTVFDQFRAGVLQTKVLDTPVHAYLQLMPTEWLEAATAILGAANVPVNALSWHIVAGGTSQWHMDAVNDDHAWMSSRQPGGWLKIYGGSKNLWFLPRTTWQALVDDGASPLAHELRELIASLTDPTVHSPPTISHTLNDMLQAEPAALWGKLQVVQLQADDLVWFPHACLHKVSTVRKSHGFGGYI
jgi:hypothetical protein